MQMDPTDLVMTAIQLAWKVYVCCESAPRSFKNISAEVRSLHGLLKETQETVLARSLPPASLARLTTILDGCTGVLTDLKALVDKYEALGKYKWTLDRITWGKEDIGELRARLTSNTVLLTGFLSTLQVDVISKLDHFMREFRDDERGRSVASSQMVQSLSAGGWPTWPTVQKKLKDIGITAAAFEANKNLIFNWFTSVTTDRTLKSGDHDDQPKGLPRYFSSSRSVEDFGTYAISRSTNSGFVPIQSFRSEDSASVSIRAQQPRVFEFLSPDATNKTPSLNTRKIDQHLRSRSAEPCLPTRPSTRPVHAPNANASVGPVFATRGRLLEAVDEGNGRKVSEIVDDEFELILIDQLTLDMALRIAAMRRNSAIARLLTEKGADVNTHTPEGSSALDFAMEEGNEKVLQVFLDKGAEINTQERHDGFALQKASASGDIDTVRRLVRDGANVNSLGGEYGSALQAASSGGYSAIAEFLLDEGAESNCSAGNLGSPLQIALRKQNPWIVGLLLNKGADVNEKGGLDASPLQVASKIGDERIVRLLLEKGADRDVAEGTGNSPLETALKGPFPGIVSLLLHRGS